MHSLSENIRVLEEIATDENSQELQYDTVPQARLYLAKFAL